MQVQARYIRPGDRVGKIAVIGETRIAKVVNHKTQAREVKALVLLGDDSYSWCDVYDPDAMVEIERPLSETERIDATIDLIEEVSVLDMARHGTWVLDQVLRALTGDQYAQTVAEIRSGEDGPDTYLWDEGIAP